MSVVFFNKHDIMQTLTRSRLLLAMHLLVLACAVLLIVVASTETFRTHILASGVFYKHLQFWTCIVFLVDFFVSVAVDSHPWRYFFRHIVYFLLCIPYIAIFRLIGYQPHAEWQFVLTLLPVIRAVSVLSGMLMTLHIGRVGGMFWGYVALALLVLYFSSMMFYIAEVDVNPEVHSYRSAVYWAVMCMTTTGSNITEMTTMGQITAGVLSATGLMLFPVFTVYVADAVNSSSGNT